MASEPESAWDAQPWAESALVLVELESGVARNELDHSGQVRAKAEQAPRAGTRQLGSQTCSRPVLTDGGLPLGVERQEELQEAQEWAQVVVIPIS